MRQLEVHLHTNTDCNLFCLHCYNKSGESSKNVMPTIEQILDTIMYICSHYNADIHLEGGECFLHPELLIALDSLPDEYLKSITITTNGTIFYEDKKIINMLKRISSLRISIEGAEEELHQKIRGYSLEKTLKNAERYQQLGVPVLIRMTLNQYNYSKFILNHIIELLKRGFSKFQVYEFQSAGRGTIHEKELSITGTLNEFLLELENTNIENIEIKMMFAARRVEEILEHKHSLELKGYKVERILQKDGISIRPNGDVYICSWDNDETHSICNWYLDADAKKIVDTLNLYHICNHCSLIRIVKLK